MIMFGAPCRIILQGMERQRRGKLGAPAVPARILGHGTDGVQIDKTFRLILGYILLTHDGRVTYSRHVLIDERPLIAGGDAVPFPISDCGNDNDDDGDEYARVVDYEEDNVEFDLLEGEQLTSPSAEKPEKGTDEREAATPETSGEREAAPELVPGFDPARRDRARRSATKNVSSAAVPMVSGKPIKIPTTYAEAMESPEAEHWRNAIETHLNAHKERMTFVERTRSKTTRTMKVRWVFTVKVGEDGEIIEYKARLVTQGFRQRPGIDFTEVFAPTIRPEQLRLILAVAAMAKGAKMRNPGSAKVVQLRPADVRHAYLNSPLPEGETVFTPIPAGYTATSEASPGEQVVLQFVKALPGMKQAGRVWHKHLRRTLIEQGFVPCEVAPCIYIKEVRGGILIAGHFVDDLIMANMSEDEAALDALIEALSGYFEMKSADELTKFLGAQFESTADGLCMHLSQYIGDLAEKYGDVQGSGQPRTPERADPYDVHDEHKGLLNPVETKRYQEITGALMYCMTTCRADIGHAVNMLARRMSNPRLHDMIAARRVLRYLCGTQRLGLLFKYAKDKDHPGLVAWVDADWANDRDSRRSTTGFIVAFNGSTISYGSALQSVISLSTCEAEYNAMSECCREVIYLRSLCEFLHHAEDSPTIIFEDNQGAIEWANDPVHHKRTKHIDVKYHYIRHCQQRGDVVVRKVHTDLNRADIFTKSTLTSTFESHGNALLRAAHA